MTKPRVYWIDTNIIIRYVTDDHPVMSQEVSMLMQQAENGFICLKVSPLVIAECCWVLQSSYYQFSPKEIADVLTSFIVASGIDAEEQDILIQALHEYASSKVDFVDAYLAGVSSIHSEYPILTYNTKDFRKMGVEHYQPAQVMNDF